MWREQFGNKFGAKSTEYKNQTYHSKSEAGYARDYDLMLQSGELSKVERQIKIPLGVNGHHICNYYVDFRLTYHDGRIELIEVKGFETEVFRLKRLLLEATYLAENPDITYRVIRTGGWRAMGGRRRR
ncbi:DUF1064 domain-containing protein [bacterium]|nr:MAG: DUF1064 domain-containing protein [bacterium]